MPHLRPRNDGTQEPENERRAFDGEVRAEPAEGGGTRLVGYAAMFNRESEPMWTPWGDLVEIIRDGAFDHAIATEQDVRALWNHDPAEPLGRTAAGTLKLSVNKTGLRYVVDLPDTARARDLVQWVERGDVSGSSFGFRVRADGEAYEEKGSRVIRELTSVDLFDVSPVTYPAYKATDGKLAIRSLEAWKRERDALRAGKRRHLAAMAQLEEARL